MISRPLSAWIWHYVKLFVFVVVGTASGEWFISSPNPAKSLIGLASALVMVMCILAEEWEFYGRQSPDREARARKD